MRMSKIKMVRTKIFAGEEVVMSSFFRRYLSKCPEIVLHQMYLSGKDFFFRDPNKRLSPFCNVPTGTCKCCSTIFIYLL